MKRKVVILSSFAIVVILIMTVIFVNRIHDKSEKVAFEYPYREVMLSENNCKFSVDPNTNKIAIDSYNGSADTLIIYENMESQKIGTISENAFESSCNLDTIFIEKEILNNSEIHINGFEISEEQDKKGFIKLESTKDYSIAYKNFIKLSDEEKAKSEIIPNKYDIPLSQIHSDDMQKYYNVDGIDEENLPEKYDLREKIKIKVEDQSEFGICYACASIKSIETNLALTQNDYVDLSDVHAAVFSNGYGGYFLDSTQDYFVLKQGPVFEKDCNINEFLNYEYEDEHINNIVNRYLSEEERTVTTAEIEEAREYLSQNSAVKYVTESINFPTVYNELEENIRNDEREQLKKLVRNTVKKHIMNYGSVFALIDSSGIDGRNNNLYTTNSLYAYTDHAISIVGWDDNYSKDNFEGISKPQNDGAYLALNSWGDFFGDNGYFWISYEDIFVESWMSGIISVKEVAENIEVNKFEITNLESNEKYSMTDDIIQGDEINVKIEGYISEITSDDNAEVSVEVIYQDSSNIQDELNNLFVNIDDENTTYSINFDVETKKLPIGIYYIKITYGNENIFRVFEILPNEFEYIIKDDNTLEITKYNGENKNLVIPEEFLGYDVTSLGGDYWFNNFESITIKRNIENIGEGFTNYGCVIFGYENTAAQRFAINNNMVFVNLEDENRNITSEDNSWKLDLSNNTLYIYSNVEGEKIYTLWDEDIPSVGSIVYKDQEELLEFFETEGVASEDTDTIILPEDDNEHYYREYEWYKFRNAVVKIEIQDEVTKIYESSFRGFNNLEEVEMSDSVEEIEKEAFSFCRNLKNITLSNNLKAISKELFYCCFSIKNIQLPENLEKIEEYAFTACEFERIELPDTVSYIGEFAFLSCSKLKEINLPENLKVINDYAFASTGIESIEIPESVENIGEGAFNYCSKLKNILFNSINQIPDFAFYRCEGLENVVLPDNCEMIGISAFEECKSLKNIDFNSSLKQIGENAFKNSELEELRLPESLEQVGNNAFSNLNLKNIEISSNCNFEYDETTFAGTTLTIDSHFEIEDFEAKVRVPEFINRINDSSDILYSQSQNGIDIISNWYFSDDKQYFICHGDIFENTISLVPQAGVLKGLNIILEFEIDNPNLYRYLQIVQMPNKFKYYEGESFAPEGLRLVLIEEHEEKFAITEIEDFQILDGENLSCDQSYIEIAYKDWVTFLPIYVMPNNLEPENIEIIEIPEYFNCYKDENAINLSGLKLKIELENDEEIIEEFEDVYYECFTPFNEYGDFELTINPSRYVDYEFKINVKVIDYFDEFGFGYNIKKSTYVTDVLAKTPIEDFKRIFLNDVEEFSIEVIKDPMADKVYVATGDEVQILDGENVLKTYKIVVKGDATGDGIVNGYDSNLLKASRAEIVQLTDIQKMAADLTGNGIVDYNDSKLILLHRAEVRGYSLDYVPEN